MGLAGKVGAVFVQTDAAPVSFTDEATTANSGFTRYMINAQGKRYWAPDADVTVKINGSVVNTGYRLEYPGGVVVFDHAQDSDVVVTVSGKYLTVEQAGGFFNWSLDVSGDSVDVTTLGSGWKSFVPTINGFTGTAEAYWGNERFFALLGSTAILSLYADASSSMARYEGFGIVQGDGIEVNVDDVVKESIDFQGTGRLYYRP